MAQINNTKKPPQFDGSNYPYWKAKMTTYIKSINMKVVETKIEIEDEEAPTAAEEMLLQNNDIALSAIHDALDERTFENRLLPNDAIFLRNIGEGHEGLRGRGGGVDDQQGRSTGPVQHDFESASASRTSLP